MKYGLPLLGAALAALFVWPAFADIRRTRHNFAFEGAGALQRFGQRRICVYCHTPHRSKAAGPAWNRSDGGRVYVKYWSPTLDAYGPGGAPPIDGVSRLCLSCHDGTVALSKGLRSGRPALTARRRGLGIDLAGSHPLSFRITESLIIRNNARDLPLRTLAEMKNDREVKLDSHDKIQCTTCHDPHNDRYRASSGVPLYRKPTWEGVCLTCHIY